jgi:hypothetical protein
MPFGSLKPIQMCLRHAQGTHNPIPKGSMFIIHSRMRVAAMAVMPALLSVQCWETRWNVHKQGHQYTYVIRMSSVVWTATIVTVAVWVPCVVPISIPRHGVSRIIPREAISTHWRIWHRFEVRGSGGGVVVWHAKANGTRGKFLRKKTSLP